ncbi:MAG TPA: DUF4258 domain-containing protein [Candidatus Hypogeohydataceae bacterium YC41]
MKNIEIIPIARRKMEKRGIKEEWVIEAVESPEQLVAGYGNRQVAHKRIDLGEQKRLLRVVYEVAETRFIVITAYLTSQIARYWKEEKA